MYEQYWQLHRRPFDNSMDPSVFFESRTHRLARLRLGYVLEAGLGAGMLVGGVGCGKTALVNFLAHQIKDRLGPVIRVPFPRLNSAELMTYLAVELGADEANLSSGGLDRIVRRMETLLLREAELGRSPTIVIDDAHLIDDYRVLQSLQLLLNFQQRPPIRFTLLLVGEWSLLGQVQRIAQLDDRLRVRSVLQALSSEETAGYVRHRLAVAGTRREVFDASALRALFELTGGVPRRINQLCDLSLLVGCADRLTAVSAKHVEAVADELMAVTAD